MRGEEPARRGGSVAINLDPKIVDDVLGRVEGLEERLPPAHDSVGAQLFRGAVVELDPVGECGADGIPLMQVGAPRRSPRSSL